MCFKKIYTLCDCQSFLAFSGNCPILNLQGCKSNNLFGCVNMSRLDNVKIIIELAQDCTALIIHKTGKAKEKIMFQTVCCKNI